MFSHCLFQGTSTGNIGKHFFVLLECFATAVPRSSGNNERVERKNDVTNPNVAPSSSFPVQCVKI